MLLREVRLVPVGGVPAPSEPVDVRIRDGIVVGVGPRLPTDAGEQVVECEGRYAAPGLWDKHVHLAQWAAFRRRLDTSGTTSPGEVLARVAARLPAVAEGSVLVGYGHRTGTWSDPPTVAALDAVAGSRAVVLISGDAHHAWLSSAALRLLDVPDPLPVGPLEEEDWFSRYPRLAELCPVDLAAYAEAVAAASALGVVGVVDLEFGSDFLRWPERWHGGVTGLRVRSATYPDGLPLVAGRGLRSGDPLVEGQDQVVMGPLKVISDGSLNTRTALCCSPYADTADAPALSHPWGAGASSAEPAYGRATYDAAELTDLLSQAQTLGLDATVHAIGDAALHEALAAFSAAGDWGGRSPSRRIHRRSASSAAPDRAMVVPARATVVPVSATAGATRATAGATRATAGATRATAGPTRATVVPEYATAGPASATTGPTRGSIEHVQLVGWDDLDTMAALGLTASVQPAHLWDDRDVSERCWPDRTERCFAFRAMADRGIPLALGSDAPVSPLDPWLAMAAAVHRSAGDREPWHPEQALTVAEALAASTDGATTLAVGSRADIVLLDADPLAPQDDSRSTASHLRGIRVGATLVAGRFTHRVFGRDTE
ncbi:conserved hypothetical protein [Nostocoides japonicum T1-X7]|uniref:Amidohydrolase 3 domain-containing protein n=1 Tax=Nostocoides japonicum T1-X7 TaxID=1194083 RepID=A0A077LU93_9MICO|nr:amidohydrolase family protein [Tetrasphaera japonica]CCH77051.1 conserved hypothetical protein [Tetrasphaera japonica T1-X7]